MGEPPGLSRRGRAPPLAPDGRDEPRRSKASAAVAEPVAEEVLQLRDSVNLLDGRLQVVLDTPEADGVAVEQHIAGPRVAVARLPHAAHVAQGLAAVELVGVVDLIR